MCMRQVTLPLHKLVLSKQEHAFWQCCSHHCCSRPVAQASASEAAAIHHDSAMLIAMVHHALRLDLQHNTCLPLVNNDRLSHPMLERQPDMATGITLFHDIAGTAYCHGMTAGIWSCMTVLLLAGPGALPLNALLHSLPVTA